MSVEQLLGLIAIIVGAVAFLTRTITKKGAEFVFARKLEEVKQENRKQLDKFRRAHEKELEFIRGEIDIAKQSLTVENDAKREAILTAVRIRAEYYPKLVTCLRQMKTRFEFLFTATGGGRGIGAIDLKTETEDVEFVRRALSQLVEFEKRFDEMLSEVRMFTTRSDYYLPEYIKNYAEKWLDGRSGHEFTVTEEEMETVITNYSDDVAFLAGEFYDGPYYDMSPYENAAFQLMKKYLFRGKPNKEIHSDR